MYKARPSSADPTYAQSSSFRSVSREQQPTWGNRFIQDKHDLAYDANPHSIANKMQAKASHSKTASQEEIVLAPRYQYSPVRAKQSQVNLKKGSKVQKYIASVQEMEKGKRGHQSTATSRKTRFHQQNIEVQPFRQQIKHYPQIVQNRLGLSRFQYASTIEGQLSKSNHHLDFNRNKTNKIDNVNKVWYDKSKDIEPKHQEKEKKISVERIHQFQSYSPHRLFHRTKRMLEDNGSGNGGMLDKFYPVPNYNLTHKRTLTSAPNYQSMSARAEPPSKLGTNLQYKIDKLKTMGVGNAKRGVMHMSNSARKLIFNRQVISPARGCCR